jgi:dTDP-4-amino-4,6-dideoxygalactose transaminase
MPTGAKELNGDDSYALSRNKAMKIPFVDLGAQYNAHKTEFDSALAGVITNNTFIGGEPVREFERSYEQKYGVDNCIACANGTDAIYIALRMLGIGPGDEVITTAASWISTSETISQTGAVPVFVDVDDHYLIDVDLLERAITSRTRAVIPVHLYGQPAQMTRILEICANHDLRLLEDCAQAHFAEWQGQRVGTFGDIATFSFYPGKNLGAWGDAGAIITNDDDLAQKCRMFANHGALVKHQHEMEGINSRMDGLQAALLTTKLRHIDEWTKARQAVRDPDSDPLSDRAAAASSLSASRY